MKTRVYISKAKTTNPRPEIRTVKDFYSQLVIAKIGNRIITITNVPTLKGIKARTRARILNHLFVYDEDRDYDGQTCLVKDRLTKGFLYSRYPRQFRHYGAESTSILNIGMRSFYYRHQGSDYRSDWDLIKLAGKTIKHHVEEA